MEEFTRDQLAILTDALHEFAINKFWSGIDGDVGSSEDLYRQGRIADRLRMAAAAELRKRDKASEDYRYDHHSAFAREV